MDDVWLGRVVYVVLPLIAHALLRWRWHCSGHIYRMPCWLPLHHRHVAMQPLRTWHIQPRHRPVSMQLLRPWLLRQRVRSVAVLFVRRTWRLHPALFRHPQLQLRRSREVRQEPLPCRLLHPQRQLRVPASSCGLFHCVRWLQLQLCIQRSRLLPPRHILTLRRRRQQ